MKNLKPELIRYLKSLESSESKPQGHITCKCLDWGEGQWRIESGIGRRYRILPIDKIPNETKTRLTILKMVNDGDHVEGIGIRVLDNMVYVAVPRAEYDVLFS